MEQTLEKFEQVTFPGLTSGVQASPAKTSVYQETNWDLKESVQACFSQLQSLLEIQKKKIDPTCYSLKTLKIYYQLIEEPTFSSFSLSWPKSGMMHSGTLKTQSTGCHKIENGFSLLPQSIFDLINRPEPHKTVMDIVENDIDEKYYLKQEQTEKLLEKLDQKSMDILLAQIENENENISQIKQLIGGSQGNRVYSPDGLSVTLGAKTGLYAFIDLSKKFPAISENSRCLQARYQKGMTNRKAEISGILQIGRGFNKGGIKNISPSLTSSSWHTNNFATKQMGFEIKIRRLTPSECFRLQGMPEESIDKAFETIVRNKPISDSQLYKITGNGVTVPVITAIAEAIKKVAV